MLPCNYFTTTLFDGEYGRKYLTTEENLLNAGNGDWKRKEIEKV